MASGGAMLFFTVIPLSIYILMLPVELIAWWLMRTNVPTQVWMTISFLLYIALNFSVVVLIQAGYDEFNVLLDWDLLLYALHG